MGYVTGSGGTGGGGIGGVEQVATVTASGSAQTISDPTVTPVTVITLSAACTITLPSATAGAGFTLILKQDGTGGRVVTWTGTVTWPGAAAPTLTGTASAVDAVTFLCVDGTSWIGFPSGYDLR